MDKDLRGTGFKCVENFKCFMLFGLKKPGSLIMHTRNLV